MKPARKNKLAVHRETVRPLNQSEMAHVAGGTVMVLDPLSPIILGDIIGGTGSSIRTSTRPPPTNPTGDDGSGFSF